MWQEDSIRGQHHATAARVVKRRPRLASQWRAKVGMEPCRGEPHRATEVLSSGLSACATQRAKRRLSLVARRTSSATGASNGQLDAARNGTAAREERAGRERSLRIFVPQLEELINTLTPRRIVCTHGDTSSVPATDVRSKHQWERSGTGGDEWSQRNTHLRGAKQLALLALAHRPATNTSRKSWGKKERCLDCWRASQAKRVSIKFVPAHKNRQLQPEFTGVLLRLTDFRPIAA